MHERRRFARVPLALSLEIIESRSAKHLGKGFVTNLSEGGLALETPKTFHAGDRLRMRFSLPDGADSFNLEGEIVYAKDGILTRAYGAQFGTLEPVLAEKLKDFLCARAG